MRPLRGFTAQPFVGLVQNCRAAVAGLALNIICRDTGFGGLADGTGSVVHVLRLVGDTDGLGDFAPGLRVALPIGKRSAVRPARDRTLPFVWSECREYQHDKLACAGLVNDRLSGFRCPDFEIRVERDHDP